MSEAIGTREFAEKIRLDAGHSFQVVQGRQNSGLQPR